MSLHCPGVKQRTQAGGRFLCLILYHSEKAQNGPFHFMKQAANRTERVLLTLPEQSSAS